MSEGTALGKSVIKGSLPGAIRTAANTADGFLFPAPGTGPKTGG